MRINSHSHIFTLYTVASHEAVDIIVQRVKALGIPFLDQGVRALLMELIDRPQYLSESELLRQLLGNLANNGDFKAFLAKADGGLPVALGGLVQGLIPSAADGVSAAIDALVNLLDSSGNGAIAKTADVIATILLAMKVDAVAIADSLLQQIPDDPVLVALMMDITGSSDDALDARRFRQQMKEASDAAIARPGRILPFVAIHPDRADHFALMQRAVEQLGFVGVKLYPSLGYAVDTPAMLKVYDYCLSMDLPITMHCSPGGFYRTQADIADCDPGPWKAILSARPNLRVCFAHCGGASPLCTPGALPPDSWGQEILNLMSFPNVYADISYHDDPMHDPGKRTVYFDRMNALLADPRFGARIIFGTDSWLVRVQSTEEHYWSFFAQNFSAQQLAAVAESSPRAFLGLPDETGANARGNIVRHVAWLGANADRLGATPANWVGLVNGPTAAGSRPVDPEWTTFTEAHYWTYAALKHLLTGPQQAVGFSAARRFTMGDIGFTQALGESDLAFKQRCLAAAVDIVNTCSQRKPILEGSWTDTTLADSLAQSIAEPSVTLPELAADVAAAFVFPSDPQ